MKFKLLIWVLFLPLFLFFLVMFFIEVSLYSLLPSSQGGMGFFMELKNVWYRSIWFYAMLVSIFFLFYFSFLKKRE
ncbi:hypothetical protein [Bacillus badius]|uniref:hypothetical protein n=1 Tax=Bacillus badius TaxID=1455 RepID=UPI0007B3982E|nr:hypothetical protein [Bacillus badius]KZR60038.1 hypothetical protein A3781_07490 [Bacillus badius]